MISPWTYIIIMSADLPKVDFSEVLQTSEETVRKSIDGTKAVLKYEGSMPSSIVNLSNKEGAYTHEEILIILAGEEWTINEPY